LNIEILMRRKITRKKENCEKNYVGDSKHVEKE
jgi:hypothetical protein